MNRQEAVRRATELVEQMSVEELASQLRFDADEIPHLDIPEYNWWNEGLHGVARAGTATVFPQAIGLGATFDEELLERIGVAVSTEARAKYNENEKQYQKEIREVYNSDNLFKNRNKNSDISEVNEVENTVTMVEYKESFISRIINKIKQLFKKVQ